jgi:mannose-6-phosphate isomerase-like protein (cupin superfamily)
MRRSIMQRSISTVGERPRVPSTVRLRMAGYTIRNLKEIEDSAVKFGLSPDLEARFVADALGQEASRLSYQRLAPNYRFTFGHTHEQQEEVYVLVAGSGRIKLDDEIVDLRRWDAVRVAKETMRCIEAGPEGLELIAIGAPATGPGDAQTSPGWWTD